MSVPACFSAITGLSRKEDLCVDNYLPEYSDSDSGLYLDELQGMSLRILNKTGGNSDVWEKMFNARENAVLAFKIDVMTEILKTKEPAHQKFFGSIGNKPFTTKLSADTYHGLRLYSDMIGGSFTLRGVSITLDVTEAVNLLIYDDYDLLHTIALTSQAGRPKYNTLAVPIELALTGNYYFIYQTTGRPYNNYLNCNCGGRKWCFNIDQPCYNPSRDKWTEWTMAAGIHGSDLNERDDWSLSREARGLSLHGDFGCDTLGILCSEHSDFDNNQVDLAIAHAINFKSGSFLSGYIMDSEEVNRYTLLGIDGLTANMLYYEERYKAMIEFIAANIELNRSECLKCKAPMGYKRHTQYL